MTNDRQALTTGNGTKQRIEYRCKCESCKGTGIYVGMAERDGAGVVCHTCKGTGARDVVIQYEDFTGRVERSDVSRVYATNPGIVIGEGGDRFRLSDFGGIPYEEWLSGRRFERGTENRRFTCPYWWYQSADYGQVPKWDECHESLGRSFSQCPHFPNKHRCWARFDEEQGS